MKKILLSSLLITALASCRHYPNFEDLTYKPIVATSHDSTANFGSYETYYMSDRLTLIGDNPSDTLVDNSVGDQIVDAIKTNMANRGYTRVANSANADIGVNNAIITITTTVVSYPPSYWWGYPGYGGCYYGYCGGYYPTYPYYGYGYALTYTYSTGSLMIQMADLKNVDTTNHRINIIWTNFNTGVLSTYTSTNISAAVDAVNQAFTQSPYLKTN
jgi:hypothetical protein